MSGRPRRQGRSRGKQSSGGRKHARDAAPSADDATADNAECMSVEGKAVDKAEPTAEAAAAEEPESERAPKRRRSARQAAQRAAPTAEDAAEPVEDEPPKEPDSSAEDSDDSDQADESDDDDEPPLTRAPQHPPAISPEDLAGSIAVPDVRCPGCEGTLHRNDKYTVGPQTEDDPPKGFSCNLCRAKPCSKSSDPVVRVFCPPCGFNICAACFDTSGKSTIELRKEAARKNNVSARLLLAEAYIAQGATLTPCGVPAALIGLGYLTPAARADMWPDLVDRVNQMVASQWASGKFLPHRPDIAKSMLNPTPAEDTRAALKAAMDAKDGSAIHQALILAGEWDNLSSEDQELCREAIQVGADLGHGGCILRLGSMCDLGGSDETAFEWYTKGVEAGSLLSVTFLGHCYRDGTGVARDSTKALSLYRQAAEGGSCQGMSDYGFHLKRGGDWGPGDDAAAFEWFKKAAECEDSNSVIMADLAFMYLTGSGTPVDLVEAYRWAVASFLAPNPTIHMSALVGYVSEYPGDKDPIAERLVQLCAILPSFIDRQLYVDACQVVPAVVDLFPSDEVPEEATRIRDATFKVLKALGSDRNPPPGSLDVYYDYLEDAKDLFMIGLSETHEGNSVPWDVFKIVTDLLRRCATQKTEEQLRNEQLKLFADPPWSHALAKIRRDVGEFVILPDGRIGREKIGDEGEPEAVNMKLPLPSSAASSVEGTGEGIWGMAHPAVRALCESGEHVNGKVFVGVVDNMPTYPNWRHLQIGDPVVFECRSTTGPIVFFDQAFAVANYADRLVYDLEYEPSEDDERRRDGCSIQ